jgi:hypothetical protein
MGISLPNVIINSFNAVYHEIKSRIIKYCKTNDAEEKKAQKE